jgi:hypothetical protein
MWYVSSVEGKEVRLEKVRLMLSAGAEYVVECTRVSSRDACAAAHQRRSD